MYEQINDSLPGLIYSNHLPKNQGRDKAAEEQAVTAPQSKRKDKMTTQNTNPFFAPMSDSAEFERLEDGVYNGVCVGVEMREYRDYNDPNATVQKATYIFQVAEGGQTFYFRTKPLKVVIGEKSNLFILINTWTGASLEKMTQGFSMDKMVGYPAQLVINTVTGKDGKQYANLANVLKVKKGVKVPVTPDAIPAYLVRNSIASILADGITVKEDNLAVKAATFPKGLPGGLASAGAGGVPVAGGANPAVYPPAKSAVPEVPANAQITQNQNAAAFMNPQLQVTQPAAAPAPAVPAAEQAPDQGEDSDDDLPF
jgi:hypothetical protein